MNKEEMKHFIIGIPDSTHLADVALWAIEDLHHRGEKRLISKIKSFIEGA